MQAANSGQREIRVVRLPGGPIALGALAGTSVAHPFVPDGHTGTSCMACFGWCTDYRHWPVTRPVDGTPGAPCSATRVGQR